jgi:hypothetical protein
MADGLLLLEPARIGKPDIMMIRCGGFNGRFGWDGAIVATGQERKAKNSDGRRKRD